MGSKRRHTQLGYFIFRSQDWSSCWERENEGKSKNTKWWNIHQTQPGLGCLQAWLELAELAGVCLESGVCGGDRGEGGARCYTNKWSSAARTELCQVISEWERDWIMNSATRYMWLLCNVSLSRCHVWWRVTRDNVVTTRGWGDGSVDHEHWCSIEKSFSLSSQQFHDTYTLVSRCPPVHVTCQLSLVHSSQIHTCHVYSNCLAAGQ